ncbi:hypothetical protein WA577_003851, partial [Blastocystis sp. JDR]
MPIKAPDPLFVLRCDGSPVSCLHSNTDTHMLVSGTQSGNVIFWDITLRRPIVQKKGLYTDGVIEAGFVCDDTAFSHGREGVLTIHRIANSTVSEETSYSCGSLTFMKASIASSDSSPIFFVPGDNDSISLLDTRDKQSHPFIPQQKTRGMVMCCYGSLSSTCVVGYESGHVCVYDCNTRQMLRELQVFKEPVISMAVASSLGSCACGSTGRDVVFCSLGEEMLSSRLELPNNGVLSLAIRGDDRLLAIGGKDGIVRIVDYRRKRPLALLPNHSGEVNGVCYGKDNTLFSGGGDSRIMGWEIYKNG